MSDFFPSPDSPVPHSEEDPPSLSLTSPHTVSSDTGTPHSDHEPEPASQDGGEHPAFVKSSRITRAGQKLLAQAKQSLPRTEHTRPPQKARKPQAPALRLKKSPAAELSDAERSQLVEVTDKRDRPLLYMLPEAALRQHLQFRIVLTALRTRDNTLILHKRTDLNLPHSGKWDLYSGPVRVGEAREDAALRLLADAAGINSLPLSLVASRPGDKELPLYSTLFVVDMPAGLYPTHDTHELLTVDSDELDGLVQQVPELLTPGLIWAASTGVLFHTRKKKAAKRPIAVR